jgi:hypothetical protein
VSDDHVGRLLNFGRSAYWPPLELAGELEVVLLLVVVVVSPGPPALLVAVVSVVVVVVVELSAVFAELLP